MFLPAKIIVRGGPALVNECLACGGQLWLNFRTVTVKKTFAGTDQTM